MAVSGSSCQSCLKAKLAWFFHENAICRRFPENPVTTSHASLDVMKKEEFEVGGSGWSFGFVWIGKRAAPCRVNPWLGAVRVINVIRGFISRFPCRCGDAVL